MSPVNQRVSGTTDTIVNRSARGVRGVLVNVASHFIAAALPLKVHVSHSSEAIDKGFDLLKEADVEQTIELASEKSKGQVTKLGGEALKRATKLLGKVLDGQKANAVAQGRVLAAAGSESPAQWTPLTETIMGKMLGAADVVADGSLSIDSVGWAHRRLREAALGRLEHTNKLWVGPVRYVSSALGPLWFVPLPIGVPLAPIVAGMLLVYVVVVSGDQLDSKGPFPNFWKGVRLRAAGH